MAQAYQLVKENGDNKLVIIWELEKACWIPYYEVFSDEQFADIDVEVIEFSGGSLYKDLKGMLLKLQLGRVIKELKFRKHFSEITAGTEYIDFNPGKGIGWSGDAFDAHCKEKSHRINESVREKGTRTIYTHAFNGIMYDPSPEKESFSEIKFRENLSEEANSVLAGNECVGIHIRRTDHLAAIENSSTENFVKKMQEIIAEDAEVKFFLATDDVTEQKRMIDLFGDRIIIQQNKVWGRDNTAAMISGIVDMLCLSKCKRIIGSYTSAYSYFAAVYGQKDIEYICGE